ncbi:hypothetical protein [Acetobacter fallax]|uniref:Uncharacterized protein n=1 Tax=Acetobacter fallax TaxID=1737473 RepID=A0ABX0KCQ5_9PROT|nr:hypothetical protein [Acetobacter fallax]NHO33462.1 hypothetical protein [Acetobacter fallax]NHO37059.1 hypothetical protein [Acetobacter fallax]
MAFSDAHRTLTLKRSTPDCGRSCLIRPVVTPLWWNGRQRSARDAHPHEDHLLPLMVAAGAATGEPGIVDFHGHAPGKSISGFRFG